MLFTVLVIVAYSYHYCDGFVTIVPNSGLTPNSGIKMSLTDGKSPKSSFQTELRQKCLSLSSALLSGVLFHTQRASAAKSSVDVYDDEVRVTLGAKEEVLGLGLKEYRPRPSSSPLIVVNQVTDNAPAAIKNSVKKGYVLRDINGNNIQGRSLNDVATAVKIAIGQKDLMFTFRDPNLFFSLLNDTAVLSGRNGNGVSGQLSLAEIKTLILPADPATDSLPQVLSVKRLEPPSEPIPSQVATKGDVIEVSFNLKIQETGEVIDGVVPIADKDSTMCDTNMFFTLGSDKRPVNPLLEGGKDGGKDDYLPARWDLSLQGMAVGEVRQIDLPPALGLQSAAYKPEAVFKQDNLDVRTKVSGNVGALAMGEVKVSKGVAGSSDGETNTVDFGSTNSARRSKSLSAHPGSALVLTVRLLSINGETRKGKLSDQNDLYENESYFKKKAATYRDMNERVLNDGSISERLGGTPLMSNPNPGR